MWPPTHGRKRRPCVSVEVARETSGLEPVDPGPGPGHGAEQAERCLCVRQAIDALDEEHRAVLILREMDGCCYETIAEILDLPIGTVRSRLHRARLRLRDLLKEVLILDD